MFDIAQISRAVFARRSADGEEDHERTLNGGFQIGGEGETPGLRVFGDELIETGFVDGHLAFGEAGNFIGVNINAHHVDAKLGEARARHQADIATADDCNLHTQKRPFRK